MLHGPEVGTLLIFFIIIILRDKERNSLPRQLPSGILRCPVNVKDDVCRSKDELHPPKENFLFTSRNAN